MIYGSRCSMVQLLRFSLIINFWFIEIKIVPETGVEPAHPTGY